MATTLTPTAVETQPQTETTRTFVFHFDDPPAYRAGQYVTVKLAGVDDPRGPQRPFTLSSSPTATDHLAITVKMTGSPFKQALQAIATDGAADRVQLRGPLGDFTLEPARPAVMVAGGIGITPFISMLRWLRDQPDAPSIRLLYSNDTPEDIAFQDELNGIAEQADWLDVVHTITQPDSAGHWTGRSGRIDAELIASQSDDLDSPVYYLCGPPGMVSAMENLLQDELDVPAADVRSEKFSGY
ncbi:ferredoxin-NADP reductase [Methylohalomonas lacus]|uniref:Ferredoxin-NADP reductase n=1 Tax=Methylohalomonas lacus TaxID=398773 RepID=A0AAE3HH49_9GAMM|nr:FAD-binding oxidoreductase [Methylohalomonas lacus]MCS3902181.1 ferredoxin-NADP reductase [Methylohalomonas lacus]